MTIFSELLSVNDVDSKFDTFTNKPAIGLFELSNSLFAMSTYYLRKCGFFLCTTMNVIQRNARFFD